MQVKACVIQDSPVFFNKEKTLAKVEKLVAQYAKQGCQLILFPESFIPGYPRGFTFGAKVGSRSSEGRKIFVEYYNNSISLEDPEIEQLELLAETHGIYIVIGVTERNEHSGSLYCSVLYLSPTEGLLDVHRKIKPTGTERIIWAEASGESLVTFDTRIGKLGGLICWENYMPLARMSMYQKGVEIYMAPTADSREQWIATMQHIALEGRCFVMGCNQYFTKSMYPEKYQHLLKNEAEDICRGGSVIVSPFGKIIAGPLFDQAGALIAELNLKEIIQGKMDLDVNGHYSRDDIFRFDAVNQPDMVKEIKKNPISDKR